MPQVKDIREYKRTLREQCKSQRAALPPEEKHRLDEAIANRFLSSNAYKNAGVLLIYVSKGIEIDTGLVINRALADGKELYVPRCRTEDTDLDFYRINSLDELNPGAFGVLEPDTAQCPLFDKYDRGLCVVPALCYDTAGYRLGFGKGYFDRFLSRYSGKTAGLAYSFQMKRSLWRGRYDRPVNLIVTDRRIITCPR